MNKYRDQGNRDGFQAMRAEMQTIQTVSDEQLELVLTDEQMEQCRALRAQIQERFRSQRGGRCPPGSGRILSWGYVGADPAASASVQEIEQHGTHGASSDEDALLVCDVVRRVRHAYPALVGVGDAKEKHYAGHFLLE